ncbi:MAG: iron-containing alcohol dehydrogenase, partial [Planctomycetota bacterium]
MNHAFSFPTDVRLGPGVRSLLAGALAEAGVKRPLVVTDDGVVTLGFFQQIAEGLAADGRLEPATFAGVHGNPTESQVAAGLEAYRAHGADGIVAVGGGAPTDVAKAIGLVATNEGTILEYADDAIEPRVPTRPAPWIAALPTTAGTGSEVGRSSVISEEDTHRKRVVFQPVMLPRLVLADAELLVGLPAKLTAATGMDALTHLIEAYLATGYHPMCDGIAVEGVLLVKGALARSVDAPADLEAREAMLMASMMGAVAFQKGLGINHACAHALSAVLGTHHGLANAVMLEDALRFNAGEPACAKRM